MNIEKDLEIVVELMAKRHEGMTTAWEAAAAIQDYFGCSVTESAAHLGFNSIAEMVYFDADMAADFGF